ncbi:hypothetical protein [Pseudomonas putida]|uniref:Uncharacterized protein n=1 Tax=Pseudomonas putida TaxID=303 RepID=A0A6I6XYZ4_PSEPU|nr:hypothetical protein [Pseudomonas putida]QHG65274.2 hypothetical protein C2H86_13025 [Pseudomonas putida]
MPLTFTPQQQLRTCAMQVLCPRAGELFARMNEALSENPAACEREALSETLLARIEDMVANKPQAMAFFAYQLHAWSNEGYLPPHSVTALYMVGKALHGSAGEEVELAPSTRVSLERLLGVAQR